MKTSKFNGVKKATIIIALAIMLTPLMASAYSLKAADSVYVPKTETIQGNLYAAGASVTVEGKVNGDVICAGQAINISGDVAGDVICAGQTINVTGKVGGSLRAAGNSINLSGQVSRNVMAFGASILTAGSSTVGWDMLTAGAFAQIAGNIGGDLHGTLGQASLSGQIGKNVNLNLGPQNKNSKSPVLTVADTAVINGNLIYTANQDAVIDGKAVIKGEITHNFPKMITKKSGLANMGWWWGKIISLFAALALGLVLISFARPTVMKITDQMLNKIGVSLGWGVLGLILTPIIAFILLITIIGIPLSLITMALWLIALYLSKILVGILIGRSLLNNYWVKQKDSLILAMIVGIIIAHLLFSLPFIGWILAMLATLWGLGGIMLSIKKA